MANFFSASQEEQQEILLTLWNKFRYLIIAALISVILFILGRDYFVDSSNEKDLLSAHDEISGGPRGDRARSR